MPLLHHGLSLQRTNHAMGLLKCDCFQQATPSVCTNWATVVTVVSAADVVASSISVLGLAVDPSSSACAIVASSSVCGPRAAPSEASTPQTVPRCPDRLQNSRVTHLARAIQLQKVMFPPALGVPRSPLHSLDLKSCKLGQRIDQVQETDGNCDDSTLRTLNHSTNQTRANLSQISSCTREHEQTIMCHQEQRVNHVQSGVSSSLCVCFTRERNLHDPV